MLAGEGPQAPSTREAVWAAAKPIIMVIIPIIPPAAREHTFKKQCPWAPMLPMLGACTTCTGTFWNGAAIGMEIIPAAPKPILKDPHRGRIGFCVGAAGPATAGIAARRAATTTSLPTASTTLAFGWSSRINSGNHPDL